MDKDQPVETVTASLLVLFLARWVVVLPLLARVSGWSALASAYAVRRPFRGPRWWFQSAELRWSGYRGCLIVGANEEGLYASAIVPFRLAHAPFFVP